MVTKKLSLMALMVMNGAGLCAMGFDAEHMVALDAAEAFAQVPAVLVQEASASQAEPSFLQACMQGLRHAKDVVYNQGSALLARGQAVVSPYAQAGMAAVTKNVATARNYAGEMGNAGLGFVRNGANMMSAHAEHVLAQGQQLKETAAPLANQAVTVVQANPYASAGIATAVVAGAALTGYCAYSLYKKVRAQGVGSVALDGWDYTKYLSRTYGRLAAGSVGVAACGVAAFYAAQQAGFQPLSFLKR